MLQQLRTPEQLGSFGLPAGCTEANLHEPRIGSAFEDTVAAADEAEDERPVDPRTQATNFLSTLRSRLPDGCVARVSWTETIDDDPEIQAITRILWVFGCVLPIPTRKYICEAADGAEQVWLRIDSLVKQASDAVEFETWRGAQTA